ncbi:hypothetical protein Esti_003393 [Eimeria stiedai]
MVFNRGTRVPGNRREARTTLRSGPTLLGKIQRPATTFDLKAGGWRMRDLGFIQISVLEDRASPIGGVGLCQDSSTTGSRHNNAQFSLSVDSHYAAQPRLYSIADDDDPMREREATHALQLEKEDYPDIFDYPNRHKRSGNNDPRFACLALCTSGHPGSPPPCSTDVSQFPKTFDAL